MRGGLYEKRLGGKITFTMRCEGSPMAGQAPSGYANKVLHAGLTLGDGLLDAGHPAGSPAGRLQRE